MITKISKKDNIQFLSQNKKVFQVNKDNYTNTIKRLLEIDDKTLDKFIVSFLQNKNNTKLNNKIKNLKKAAKLTFDLKKPNIILKKNFDIYSSKINKVYTCAKDNPKKIYLGNHKNKHASLFYLTSQKMCNPPKYEENYFEGSIKGLGYGNYLKQSKWRIEKSERYLNFLIDDLKKRKKDFKKFSLLDIGSGYGFFRHVCNKKKIENDGLEISKFACKMSKKLFKLKTYNKDIYKFQNDKKYDVITLFDVIEHEKNINKFFNNINHHLKPGGIVFLRTPNLDAIDYDIFKNIYHSLKEEHLHIFSIKSLKKIFRKNNFINFKYFTSSHLLKSFLGSHINVINFLNKGSDIFFFAERSYD